MENSLQKKTEEHILLCTQITIDTIAICYINTHMLEKKIIEVAIVVHSTVTHTYTSPSLNSAYYM